MTKEMFEALSDTTEHMSNPQLNIFLTQLLGNPISKYGDDVYAYYAPIEGADVIVPNCAGNLESIWNVATSRTAILNYRRQWQLNTRTRIELLPWPSKNGVAPTTVRFWEYVWFGRHADTAARAFTLAYIDYVLYRTRFPELWK